MPKPPPTPTEEIAVIRALVQWLTARHHRRYEIANRIGIRPDALSKAQRLGLIGKQRTFGFLSRWEIIQQLCAAFQLDYVKTGQGDQSYLVTFNPNPANEETLFPICFQACSLGDKGQVAFRGIFRFSERWDTARIEYYDCNGGLAKQEEGRVSITPTHLIIGVDENDGRGPSYPIGWYCFPKIRGAWQDSPLFHGLYATFSLNNYPVSGELLLVRQKDPKLLKEMIAKEAPDYYQQLLFDKRLQINRPIPIEDKSLWSYPETKKIYPYTGRFSGFYLAGAPRQGFAQSFLRIHSNGTADFKCSIFHRGVAGRVFLLEPGTLKIELERVAGSGVSRSALIFNLPETADRWEAEKALKGLFCGIKEQHLFAYRIQLLAQEKESGAPPGQPAWIDLERASDHRQLAPFQPFLKQAAAPFLLHGRPNR